jgi:hypothetical protein
MTDTNVMICGIRRESDGTYVVTDALQRSHYAGDVSGLGKIIARLYDDPDMPRSVTDTTERNEAVTVVTKIARKFARDSAETKLIDHLEPLAHIVGNKMQEHARRPGRRRPRAR